MNIIGLGRAGCHIAKCFENYDQYKTFCIDEEDKDYRNFIKVKSQISHEEYEKKYKKLNLESLEGETTLILSGSGKISGCVLRILEQIKHLPISVLYIKSDESKKSELYITRDRLVLGVLQEYARSNKLERMYLVSNKIVESVVGEVTIRNYWDEINKIVSSTYHMINVFKNTEPLLDSSVSLKDTIKITTFGVVNYKSGKEKIFYDLQNVRVKNYFYGINSKGLEDKKILNKIRKFVEDRDQEKVDAGFSIYPTEYDDNYVYCLQHASFIQEQKIE